MTSKSKLLRALLICLVLMGAGQSAFATHLRGTTISWSPTGVTGQVQFTINYSQRQSFGGCSVTGCPVGSTLPVAFSFGDGATGSFNTQVTSVNTAEDYLVSTATLLHTYTTAGPFTAFYQNTARVSTIKSGHDQQMRMETLVSPFASPANHSPVVSEPAIITLPLQATTGFVISASDLDRDTLSYRLSTASEMYGSTPFSCTIGQPPGLSVNSATGQVTWDTTQIVKAGCGYTAPVSGDLWTVQFMVQDLDSKGVVKSKTPLDIILKFISSTEAPPTLVLSKPGPITVQAGTPITFTATGDDAAVSSRITLNATGLPIGATSSNLNQQLIPAVVSTFNWTPTAAQVGSYVITYSATNDTFEQVLASITIYVQNILPPTLSCSAPLSAQYGMPINIPLMVSDPQADAISVMWSVDGTLVRTDSVPASNQTTTLTLGQTFTTLGTHTVGVRATDTDNQVSVCSTTVTVSPADQTITFAPLADATFGDGDMPLMATASSGLPIGYTASGACTIVGGAVHITGAGSCSVTASQAGNANYNAAKSVTQSFTIGQATQAIAFTAPATVPFGTAPIALNATGGASGNPVLYTVTGPATLSGGTLTITGAGNVVVTANQSGNTNYSAAAPVSQTIVVTQATQAINFTALSAVTYGAAPITLSGTGGASGNPVTYTVTGPATISGNMLTITGAGSVVVTANQAGNANYSAAPAVSQTITVNQAPQAIAFTAPASVTYGSGPITLNGTGGASSNRVTYTVTGPATVMGNVLTVMGAGSVVVTANQAGNANYSAAPAVSQTINVDPAAQAISFMAPASVTYGSGPITLAATGGASGNPITYTVTGPATLMGNVLTVTGTGNVVVTANQAGNANYSAATAVSQTILVNPAAQVISFTAPATATYGDGPITLAATGGASGNPVTYSVTGPATLTGNMLTITGAGSVVVTANQAGNANYSAATAVSQTIAVGQAAQTIAFTPPASVTYGSGPITLAATGGASGNPVTYTVTGPATLMGNVLTVTGAGNVVVTAHQAGDANYAAAADVAQTIVVNPAAQVITFNAPASATYGSGPITLAATGGASGNPVTYTVTGPATLMGNVLTVTGAGNVVVTAHQAGDANYAAATDVAQTIVVSLAAQAITFNPPATVTYGDGPITLTGTGGASGNPVTYTVMGPATLNGNVLTFTGAGVVTVVAHQAGNDNYAMAPKVVKTITVNPAAQTIAFTAPATLPVNSTYTLTGTGGASGNPVTYTVMGPATVSGNTLTITGAGAIVVTANQAGNTDYAAAAPVMQSINAKLRATVTLTAASTSFSYPNSTNLTACVTLVSGMAPTGTISIYDGTTLLTTMTVQGGGCIYYYISPSPSAGTHTLTAYYSDANLMNIFSQPLTLTVARGEVTTEVDCWIHDAPFGGNIQCDANPDSGPSAGYMTYSYDNGPLVTVQMNAASHAVFTVLAPTVGTHTIQIEYPAQGNWGSSALPLQTFIVRLAPTNVVLTPSAYYTTAGNTIKLTTSITSTSTVTPNSVGTVSFYDGNTLLGTVPVDANGTASLNTPALTAGTHSFTSSFSGTNQYAPGTGAATVSIGN